MPTWPGKKRRPRDPGVSPASAASGEPRTWAVHLSPNDRYLAVINKSDPESYRLSVHRLDGGRLVQEGSTRRTAIMPSVTWSASGELLAFITANWDVELLRISGGTSPTVLSFADAMDFSPDGSQLAVTNRYTLAIHPVDASRTVRSVAIPSGADRVDYRNPISALAFSPDGRWIACTHTTDTVLIWEARRLEFVTQLVGHHNLVLDLAWVAPDVLATSSIDRTVRIWQVPDGRELRVLEASTDFAGIAYAPSHEAVVGWGPSEFVVWSTATWDVRQQGPLLAPADGRFLGYRPFAVSKQSTLVATFDGTAIADIAFSQGWDATASSTGSVSTYANAKVLLLGDSGVGKSGLALVLVLQG
jgi:WD40 repeat protein